MDWPLQLLQKNHSPLTQSLIYFSLPRQNIPLLQYLKFNIYGEGKVNIRRKHGASMESNNIKGAILTASPIGSIFEEATFFALKYFRDVGKWKNSMRLSSSFSCKTLKGIFPPSECKNVGVSHWREECVKDSIYELTHSFPL